MKVNIKTKNIELTEAIRALVEGKLNSLNKFFKNTPDILFEVDVGKTTKHHYKGEFFRAEIQVDIDNNLLRAASQREDLRIAINDAKEELEKQLRRHKDKIVSEKRRGAR